MDYRSMLEGSAPLQHRNDKPKAASSLKGHIHRACCVHNQATPPLSSNHFRTSATLAMYNFWINQKSRDTHTVFQYRSQEILNMALESPTSWKRCSLKKRKGTDGSKCTLSTCCPRGPTALLTLLANWRGPSSIFCCCVKEKRRDFETKTTEGWGFETGPEGPELEHRKTNR